VSNLDFEEVFISYRTNMWAEITIFPEKIVQDVAKLGPTLSQRLLPVINDLWLCVRMTDSLLHRSDLNIHSSYLVDARKWTQHHLVSLPTSSELDTIVPWPSQQLRIYEVIRLGLNIFSLLTVYPLPLSAAPFATLAAQLASLLEPHPLEITGHRLLHLSLWASTMGALAAIGTCKRSFFVDIVTRESQSLYLYSWAQLKTTLQGYLWYAEVSDFDGQYLWLEVQHNVKIQTELGVREVSSRFTVV
jgi:hypothetical protein